MTKGDLDGWTFWGRPVKPVGAALVVLMMKDVVFNATENSPFGHLWVSHMVALLAAVALLLLLYSWVAKVQRVLEFGLMAAFAMYVLRGSFALFYLGFGAEVVYASIGGAIIAGGAYLLEAWDRLGVRVRDLTIERH